MLKKKLAVAFVLAMLLFLVPAGPTLADGDTFYRFETKTVNGETYMIQSFYAHYHIIRPFGTAEDRWHIGWQIQRWEDGRWRRLTNLHTLKDGKQVYLWDSVLGSGTAWPAPSADDDSWQKARCYCSRASWVAYYATVAASSHFTANRIPASLHSPYSSTYFWDHTSVIQLEFSRTGW